jgi:hypothetical protein
MILGTLFMANYPAAGVVASIVVLAVLYKKNSLMNGKMPFHCHLDLMPAGSGANTLSSIKWVLEMSSLICETDVDCLPSIACALTDLVWEYGPVVLFRQGSQVIIVIRSVEVKYIYTQVCSNNDLSTRQSQPLWRQKVDPW